MGPVPSTLTFISGQSAGDIQCSNVTILDNSVVEDERSFRVILDNDTNDNRVLINASAVSLDFVIAVDISDSKMLIYSGTMQYHIIIIIPISLQLSLLGCPANHTK